MVAQLTEWIYNSLPTSGPGVVFLCSLFLGFEAMEAGTNSLLVFMYKKPAASLSQRKLARSVGETVKNILNVSKFGSTGVDCVTVTPNWSRYSGFLSTSTMVNCKRYGVVAVVNIDRCVYCW